MTFLAKVIFKISLLKIENAVTDVQFLYTSVTYVRHNQIFNSQAGHFLSDLKLPAIEILISISSIAHQPKTRRIQGKCP